MKIKHVYGNVLRIDIPLTIKIRTIEEGAPSEREEPFYPDATKGCIVELANNYNRKIEYNATITDNIVHIEDIGKISIGQYKVTVKCYDAQGNPYRYMVRDIVEICDATADAGIEAGVEFNAETYTLEGAVFVSYGVEQVQADWEEEDETSKAFIKNKPDIYTKTETDAHINQQVLIEKQRAEEAEQTLQNALGGKQDTINDLQEIRQGAQLGATAIQVEQDPTVPQWAKAANKPSYNANEVGALPSTTKYGYTIDMVLNSTTYVLTLTLKDQEGNSLNSKSVDLPLESVVVDGRYDAASKKIILTLQSGSALDIPVGDLVAGLQTEITSTNMLDAGLVDDTNSAHKFVSAQEKEEWNNKSDFSGSYNDLTDKPVIPVVPTNVSAFNNDAGYLTEHQDISGKVDKVEGKGLSTNDYTDEEKEKLAGLENYDDTQIRQLINEEKIARQQGDNALIESITQEETRAKGVEQNLDSKIGENTEDIVTEKTRAESVEQTLQLAIDTINGKIPAQATSQNQLADKAFVNSSVSTATADFKGTYNSLEDLEQVTANANDYAFVIANDAAGNTLYKRYKWVEDSGWAWEYDLNNSSFTQAQWAAIQSGITAALVTKLSDLPDNSTLNQRITQAIATALLNYYTKSEIDTALGNKQDVIQDLATIRSGASAGATAVQPTDMSEAIDEVVQELENGNIIPAMAETLEPWADQKAIATPDTYTDAVRTTGGDIPIETSAGSKLESIKPVAGSKWTAKLLFNGSYNMLNAAKWGVANSQPYVGGVGSNFVYFLVPELILGTFGTADENNGLLFTNEDGVNVQPTSVYFKTLGTTIPQSLTDGTSITPTNVSYDGKTYKTYETSGAGWLIIPKSYYDNDVCAHIAWEDWYDKHVSLNEPDTNPEAVVGILMLEGLLTLAHANKYLLGVNDEVCDNIVFGETSATITHMVDEIEIATNAWTNSATGESDSQGNVLYRHSAIVSGIKNGGAACIEGNDGGIPLTVNGTTVSYIDTNATAPASVVFYQIPTAVETTKSYSDSVFSGSNINQETGVLPINDCSIEAQVAMEGEANITVKYAKNIVDQVAINATVDVPQIKKQVEEHEERITELEDTAVRTGSYDASVAVGLADNLKGDTIVDAEFYKRKTGGTQSVGSGIAAIKEVRGKSIVWNQLVQNGNFADRETGWNSNIVVVNNEATVTLASGGTSMQIFNHVSKIVGHKYFIRGSFKWSNISGVNMFHHIWFGGSYLPTSLTRRLPSENNKWKDFSFIVTGNTTDNRGEFNFYNYLNSNATAGDTFTARNIFCVDLTLMFGAGNEPATAEEFEKMFFLDYYDYNAGEIIPFAAQNLVTIGKNQYNPTSGKANLLGGQTYQITGTYTKLYPTVTLINYTYGDTVTAGTYYTNDSNHYVGAKTVNTYDNTKTYALGVYCAYGGSIYKSNVAIETAEEFNAEHWDVITDIAVMVSEGILTLWDIVPGINGVFTLTKDTEVTIVGGNDTDTMIAIYDNENSAYEPYEKHTLPLDPSQWRDKNGELVFPYGGMHGGWNPNSYFCDYAKVDADGYIRKAVRCFGQVDIGSLNWRFNTTLGQFEVNWKKNIKKVPSCGITPCYIFNPSTKLQDKQIFLGRLSNYENYVMIKDTTYSTADEFKAAMHGVPLIYELYTPIEVELATPIYAKYLVDKDGTEEITPANGSMPYTTPANLSILYAMDARGEIKNLPKNYLSKESAENMLNAMVAAGVIQSYTMTYDAASGRYAFVITKPAEKIQS